MSPFLASFVLLPHVFVLSSLWDISVVYMFGRMVWKVDHMLSGFLLIQIETESWVSAESTLFHITTA